MPAESAHSPSWRVPAESAGRTIEAELRRHHRDWSWDHIAKLLRQRRVSCNGAAVKRGHLLSGEERIEILPASDSPRRYLPNRRVKVRVLHEDPCLAVIAKQAGVPVHPGPGHGSDTLLNGLLARYLDEIEELGEARGWGFVQRLDRGASGVMVIARAPASYQALRSQFETRTVGKHYLALLAGDPSADEMTIDTPVRDRSALTEIHVQERFGICCLAMVRPRTGRTHQIRWHAASLGHPVVGDRRYGPERPRDHPLRRIGMRRMFLHSLRIELTHPSTLERVTFEAPLPRDLRRTLARLRGVAGEGGSGAADQPNASRTPPSSSPSSSRNP